MRDEQQATEQGSGLLPCPFCGGEPELERVGWEDQQFSQEWTVRCGNPACPLGPLRGGWRSSIYAAEAWNSRADSTPVAQPPTKGETDSDKDAAQWVTNKLRPEHKCKPLARALMMEDRDWWIGELIEPVAAWPNETHCLHMKTPLKDVSFLCNAGDFEQLLVLSNVIVKLENLPWLRASTASAMVRLMPPFSTRLPEDPKEARRVCAKCGHEESYRNVTRNYECYEGGLPPCGCHCEFAAPAQQQLGEIARNIAERFIRDDLPFGVNVAEIQRECAIAIASALTSAERRGAERQREVDAKIAETLACEHADRQREHVTRQDYAAANLSAAKALAASGVETAIRAAK